MTLRVSVIINTYNRAASLEKSLQSVRFLDYPDFEVIVVNGPSTDDTAEVMARWDEHIKAGSCPTTNLSISRNIGIAMAAGDIVAFMDDDAIPEPEWLSRLVAGYDDEEIGGVGGPTFNHTGYNLQAKYTICDRFGGARLEYDENPTQYYNFPDSFEYCAHLGTNSSFRRDTLLRIGGFDEEYEYFLDETDVCVRMIDSGYMVKFVDDAFIHHKFLPSNIRNDNRVITDWYPVIKNRAYFAVKNGSRIRSFREINENLSKFIAESRQNVVWAVGEKLIPRSQLDDFDDMARTAALNGFTRGLGQERKLISSETLELHQQPFKKFIALTAAGNGRLTICYLSEFYPPGSYGGIARFTQDLARGIAHRGHNVHVITRGADHDTVDFEDGVWVHRIIPREFDTLEIPADYSVSRKNHNYSRTVHEEVKRIDAHHRIDLIEAPIWDSEGYHCVMDKEYRDRTVVSLETTMRIASESKPEWLENPDLLKAMETEDLVLREARWFHAISRNIVETVQRESGVELPVGGVGLVPLGVEDRRDGFEDLVDRAKVHQASSAEPELRILFVGRQEPRKGADVLLDVIPDILNLHPHVKFVLVGENTIADGRGIVLKDRFLQAHSGEPLLERVEFHGHVEEDELYRQYAGCDIFVAPSRYESFGLIFLEAMMFGKPVIGCRAGGMVEIIEPEGNGLLADPGDRESLRQALERLIEDAAMRERFGVRSREIFEDRFTADRMTERTLEFYRSCLRSRVRQAR